jgi:hypothetical protein
MTTATNFAPADEMPKWPLVLSCGLLALGAVPNLRDGRGGVALVLAVVGVVLPGIAIGIRKHVGHRRLPRIRRVVVAADDSPGGTVPLDTAKYLTPLPRPGLPERVSDDARSDSGESCRP